MQLTAVLRINCTGGLLSHNLTHLLQILLLLEQATYGCTSAESQARYALYILTDTSDSSSVTACVFTVQHLSCCDPGFEVFRHAIVL